jgi:hypothetical protein
LLKADFALLTGRTHADRRSASCGSPYKETDALMGIPILVCIGVLRTSVARQSGKKRVAHYPTSQLSLRDYLERERARHRGFPADSLLVRWTAVRTTFPSACRSPSARCGFAMSGRETQMAHRIHSDDEPRASRVLYFLAACRRRIRLRFTFIRSATTQSSATPAIARDDRANLVTDAAR